jgi:hypothetical protein
MVFQQNVDLSHLNNKARSYLQYQFFPSGRIRHGLRTNVPSVQISVFYTSNLPLAGPRGCAV